MPIRPTVDAMVLKLQRRWPSFMRAVVAVLAQTSVALAAALASDGATPAATAELPRLVHEAGRYGLMVDGKPYLILGAQVNTSSAWPAMLPKVWPAIDQLGANTVQVPIAWEQNEAQQGYID